MGGELFVMLCSQAGVRSFMSPNTRQVVVAATAAASDLNQSKLMAELDGQGASWPPGAVGDRRPVRWKVLKRGRAATGSTGPE